jgi:GxxExxY protein
MKRKPTERQEELVTLFIDVAIEVHRELGPGYDEVLYANALEVELKNRGVPYEREKAVDVFYKDNLVGEKRLDFFLGGEVVVELKAVESLNKKHLSQVISYLKAVDKPLGILVNFHESLLKDGLRRVIY